MLWLDKWVDLIIYADQFFVDLIAYAKVKYPKLTKEQEDDLEHIATYQEAGLCAARGFGKTLIACIYEDFMVQRNWSVCHCFKNINQAAQWYTWMELLGYRTTLWEARKGRFIVYLRIYQQGRGM